MNLPISYILLPNKSCFTYTFGLTLFKQETQAYFSNGTNFITDFELAEINAEKKVSLMKAITFNFVISILFNQWLVIFKNIKNLKI